jgi:SNF2 family DNA or RNA helicase
MAESGPLRVSLTRDFSYPYFKFLREPHTGSYKIFKENFCSRDDPESADKLSAFLRKFMIRRTHLDTLFNARLLDLPKPTEQTLWLEFNQVGKFTSGIPSVWVVKVLTYGPIERQIYEIVKKRFISRINHISRTNSVNGMDKQYNHIWTMILRLRQLCSHSALVQGPLCDLLEREDFEKLNKITESEDEMSDEGASMLVHLRNVLKNNQGVLKTSGGVQGTVISEHESIPTAHIDYDTEIPTGGKHGLSFRFRKYLKSIRESETWDAIMQRTLCCSCRQPPQDAHVTSCFHIYCAACLTDLQHLAARRGHDQTRCMECGEAYTSVQRCDGIENLMSRETTAEAPTEIESPQKAAKKTNQKKSLEMEDWVSMPGEVLPSAKTQAMKAQVMNWLKEPEETECKCKKEPCICKDREPPKIIIYTQFLPMIRILERICKTEGWKCVKYTGMMSHGMHPSPRRRLIISFYRRRSLTMFLLDARDKAIAEFADKPEIQIMLASLKCGGLGLNLTMASRVICIEPWWNSAVEQQAFCRVFRIGQQKETRMSRFVIKSKWLPHITIPMKTR